MGIRIRSRCGKRALPLRHDRREDGQTAPAVRTVLSADGAMVQHVGKAIIPLCQLPESHPLYGTRAVAHDQQGEACAPRSALTVFLPEKASARNHFKARWERDGVRFRALHKGTTAKLDGAGNVIHVPCPVIDKRGRAYSVDGPPEVLRAMLCDPRCQGSEQASLPRHSLSTGKHAPRPKPAKGTVRRQTAYRQVNGAPCFVRI